MLKLSKMQEKIIQQKNVGVSVITGEMHSGKTSVATLRMLYLLEHACKAGERILYVCTDERAKEKVSDEFNKQYGLKNISLFDAELKGEAIIKAVDTLIEEAADKADVHLNLEICDEVPEALIVDLLPRVRKVYPKVKWLKEASTHLIQHEIRWINTCGYESFESYAQAMRKGAEIKLDKLF